MNCVAYRDILETKKQRISRLARFSVRINGCTAVLEIILEKQIQYQLRNH